jgi:hypothetical protein
MLDDAMACAPVASDTETVTKNTPGVVGLPERVALDVSKLKPGGIALPLETLHW